MKAFDNPKKKAFLLALVSLCKEHKFKWSEGYGDECLIEEFEGSEEDSSFLEWLLDADDYEATAAEKERNHEDYLRTTVVCGNAAVIWSPDARGHVCQKCMDDIRKGCAIRAIDSTGHFCEMRFPDSNKEPGAQWGHPGVVGTGDVG